MFELIVTNIEMISVIVSDRSRPEGRGTGSLIVAASRLGPLFPRSLKRTRAVDDAKLIRVVSSRGFTVKPG